jgi:hypothetical protein
MQLNGAHIHLLLNHVPVIGMVGAVVVLLWAVVADSDAVRRLALFVLLLVGISAVPAFYSGEGAERVVKHMPGVEQQRIEDHEAAGKWGLGIGILAGLFALAGLVARRGKSVPRGLVGVALVLALFGSTVFARVAWLGGEVHHPELRSGFVPPPKPPGGPADE